MELDELRKSVSDMSDAELMNEINRIRSRRRSGVSAFTTIKIEGQKRQHNKSSSLSEMSALLMSLELEYMQPDDDEEEPTDD